MKIKEIRETSIYVSELEQAEAFYGGKLGFEIIAKAPGRHIFFKVGKSVLLCFVAQATLEDTKLPSHGASGSVHIAFEVEEADYEKQKELLLKSGIELIHEQDWGKKFLKSFYFRDPDGNLLEIVPEGLWEK